MLNIKSKTTYNTKILLIPLYIINKILINYIKKKIKILYVVLLIYNTHNSY